ncbi:hypothetical protein CBR_g78818 [Chara braunii]|uniref:DUF659 domain-containing protein n=1 Tax=Chara braunii TaxID=69332 RepID=A0A388KAI9_CHABU|nr:hypothetical protein CBR_g78818 [Chara braunii]|eukprot:GBG67037.1 hypothetical protein CBR_g78818 [Chara braunii]
MVAVTCLWDYNRRCSVSNCCLSRRVRPCSNRSLISFNVFDSPASTCVMACSSKASSSKATTAAKGKSQSKHLVFVAQPEERQKSLQNEKTVYTWIEQGQEADPKEYGQYRVRCRLCNQLFITSKSRAVQHFLKKRAACPYRTGEILHLLALDGANVKEGGATAQTMLHKYRMDNGIGEDCGLEADPLRQAATELEEHIVPPLAPGRESVVNIDTTQEVEPSEPDVVVGDETAPGPAGVPFNFIRLDKTKELREVYMELAARNARMDLPAFETIRTVALNIVYDNVRAEVRLLMDKWDIRGCTLITDWTQDKKSRVVLNFVAAGESGAVLIKVVDVSDGKKNVRALAKLWEEVIREIGVPRVNAICTDNASTNKKVLVMPTEVRFVFVYQMLIRIWDRRHVLKRMMDNGWLDIYWSSRKDREDAEDIFAHVRCDIWWQKVDTILSIMKPIYDLLRMMDSDGVAPSQLWGFDDLLSKRMRTMSANFLLSPARRDPRWLLNKDSPLVHNALKFFLTQLGGNSWGDLDSHEEVWNSLWTFHCQPLKEKIKDEDLCNRFAIADAYLERKTASQWWGLYGSKHIELQKIAMRVMAMWSTATPCERNWSSLDLVHSKRRNNLSSESVAKLVYIHWNMQLLRVPRSTTDGLIDLWATFFDEPEAPPVANDVAKDRREVDKEEEAARVARLKKIPKGRLPAGLLSDDSGSSDNEDSLWCDKADNRVHRARGGKGKGKAAVVEDEEDEWDDDDDDDDTDSDFEIRPCTGCTDSDTDGGRTDLWDVPEATSHLDNDDDLIVEDSEARDRRVRAEAQSLADRDRVMVQQRMAEENSRRLAVPAHLRTVEGHVQQQAEQRPQEPVQQLVEQNPQRVVRQQQEQRPQ